MRRAAKGGLRERRSPVPEPEHARSIVRYGTTTAWYADQADRGTRFAVQCHAARNQSLHTSGDNRRVVRVNLRLYTAGRARVARKANTDVRLKIRRWSKPDLGVE